MTVSTAMGHPGDKCLHNRTPLFIRSASADSLICWLKILNEKTTTPKQLFILISSVYLLELSARGGWKPCNVYPLTCPDFSEEGGLKLTHTPPHGDTVVLLYPAFLSFFIKGGRLKI